MKKIILPLILISIYLLIATYVTPALVQPAKIQEEIITAVKGASGHEVTAVGDARLNYFPLPKYSIPGIKIKNTEGFSGSEIFSSGEIVVHPSIISLLMFSVKTSKITINNPVLSLEEKGDGSNNLDNILLKSLAAVNLDFPKIELVLGKISLNSDTNLKEIAINQISIKPSTSPGKIFSFSGKLGSLEKNISSSGDIGKFDEANNSLPVDINFVIGDSSLSLNGNIEHPGKRPEFKGKIASEIPAFAKILNSYLNISAKIPEKLHDQDLSLEGEGILNSKTIEVPQAIASYGGVKGTGALQVIFVDKLLIGLQLNLEKVDLDALDISGLENEQEKPESKNEEDVPELAPPSPDGTPPGLPDDAKEQAKKAALKAVKEKSKDKKGGGAAELAFLPDDSFFTLAINVDEVIYKKQNLRNVSLGAGLGKDLQEVTGLNVSLPGNSKVEMSAHPSIDESGQGRQMNGHLKVYGDNLTEVMKFFQGAGLRLPDIKLDNYFFESDYVYSEGKLYFPNIEMLLSDASLNGKFLIDNQNKKVEVIMQGANLDLDKIIGAIEFPKQASGANQDITVFDNLRTLPYNVRAGFSLDEFIYAQNKFKKLSGEFEIAGGILNSNLESDSESFGKIKTEIQIDALNFKPSFSGTFSADHLTLDNLVSFRSRFEDLIYTGREKPAQLIPKFDIPTADANWPIEPINFSGVNFLDAKLDLNIKSFDLGNLNFANLNTQVKMQDGIMNIEEFKAQVYGGNFDLKSNIATRGRPSASLTFALSGGDLAAAVQQLTGNDIAQGKFALSGSLSFTGFNLNDWMSQATGSGTFVTRNYVINGFNLKEVYERLPSMTTPNAYNNLMANAFSTGSTAFDYAGGNIFFADGIADLRNFEVRGTYINKAVFNKKVNLRTLNSQGEFETRAVTSDFKAVPLTATLRGPIDNIKVSWDYSAFRSYWDNIILQKGKIQ